MDTSSSIPISSLINSTVSSSSGVGYLTNAEDGGGRGRNYTSYDIKFKLEAVAYSETHSGVATATAFGVDPKRVRDWRRQKEKLEEMLALEASKDDEDTPTPPRKRIPGAGRKKQEKIIVDILGDPNKRHRRSIKLSDKVEIIRLIENGQTQSDVARSLGISQSTVQTIWSNKQEILDRNSNPKKKRKNLHWKKYSLIDHALFTWYRQCRETGVPVDGKMLLDKATEFAEYYKQPDFKPQSIRWVDMFKKRHSISEVDRQDRIQAAAVAAVEHHQQVQHNQHHSNNMGHPTSTTSAHDLVPEFDLSSFPGLMAGLYPPDPTNPSGAPPTSAPPLPAPNFNPNIPIVMTMPVTTCDAMKYVELIRSWLSSTFGENEEVMNNHLNAIENCILKRRMTEMLAPVNPHR